MKNISAIFEKQGKDMLKNASVLMMFIIFPLVAFFMTFLVGEVEGMAANLFVAMMASVFVGMALLQATAGIIAEDRETKALRALVIAGVKPMHYLLGIGGVVFLASGVTSVVFAFIGDFSRREMVFFLAVMLSGAIASIFLGAIVGIISKNQQGATGVSMPLAMVLGFGPMIAQFNEGVQRAFSFVYSQQINVVVGDFSAGVLRPLAVIWANIGVFVLLFVWIYRKKGLKGE